MPTKSFIISVSIDFDTAIPFNQNIFFHPVSFCSFSESYIYQKHLFESFIGLCINNKFHNFNLPWSLNNNSLKRTFPEKSHFSHNFNFNFGPSLYWTEIIFKCIFCFVQRKNFILFTSGKVDRARIFKPKCPGKTIFLHNFSFMFL